MDTGVSGRKPRAAETGVQIEPRDGAWVAEATGLIPLTGWPPGTRLILRKERPHPGAQLRITDADGLRSPGSSPTPSAAARTASSPTWNCGTAAMPGSRTGSGQRHGQYPRPPNHMNAPENRRRHVVRRRG